MKHVPFPSTQRVIYKRNPLVEVVCEFKFPRILKIEAEPPAAFQEILRKEFPLFKENTPPSGLPAGAPPQLLSLMGRKNYELKSADEKWTVGLNAEALSLQTTEYRRWEEFRDRLTRAVAAFESVYEPGLYVRIGLRYIDVLQRSRFGLADVPWGELLQPPVAAELVDKLIADDVTNVSVETEFTLSKEMTVTLRRGLAIVDGEQVYIIDADFYTDGKIRIEDAKERLGHFNSTAGHLFRWCISTRLHEALEPEPLQ